MRALAGWVTATENRAARIAVERVAGCIGSGAVRRTINPLFLHGPAGTGKTRLVKVLADEAIARVPDAVVSVLPAGDLRQLLRAPEAPELQSARAALLLIVEDLQHLHPDAVEGLVALLDRALATQRQVVCTAVEGPARLTRLPARLTSRLASGLVVGLDLFGPMARRAYLRQRLEQKPPPVPVPREVVECLAECVAGSARQLEGALVRLDGLIRLYHRAPTVEEVAAAFQDDAAGRRPTMERIIQKVGTYYQVGPRQLRSRRRMRGVLLARQVGMYLARQLTELSLEQIGAYFGGRDHSTVLHAVRKVEEALTCDPLLSGAVRQLHADLA